MKLLLLLLVASAATSFQANAQTTGWDSSGNGMLNGTYYFRQVYYVLSSNGDGSLNDALALYGTATFDGAGKYSMSVTLLDLANQQQPLQNGTLSGTYSIAASGQGFLSSPLPSLSGDYVFGMVNQQGIFVGSSTETLKGYNDLFIAAPLASLLPTASTFRGAYSMAYMDLSGGSPQYTIGLMAQMNADGAGKLGTVSVAGYLGGNGSTKTTQSLSNVTYIFSGGAAKVTFPTSKSALLSGQYYLYFSPDGNFFFGGSPFAADMLVGVRTGAGTPNLSGLYSEAGINEDESTLGSGYATLDTFYGSFSADSGVLVGHQRLNSSAVSLTYNYTYADSYTLGANGTYSNPAANYVVGPGIRIASGIGPFLGLSVGLAAPSVSPSLSSSGVFLNPQGVVNAGSSAPFTAGIAPGELLTLYGSNMAASAQVAAAVPFPTTLNHVQVMINNTAAPLYYVTPTQIAAIVPYAVTTGVAQVQVISNGVASNTVSMQVATTAPGVLTQNKNGLGYGDAVHQDGSLVTAQNPAKIGETVELFLTGLGAVNPAIADGAPGPSDTPSKAVGTITAFVGGVQATVTYAGLAPQLAGLYQINLTIPAGITAGDNGLDISGPDAYSAVCLIPIGSASTASPAAESPASREARRPLPRTGARVPPADRPAMHVVR